ncbi:hypothetical protein PIB30_077080 [Stylosanthes scabra]|uniref:Uncharacterized protein n=1 Tax=Stylosanthes scabra TaxID=79078 RepID=A0ABU6QQ49_9FABA|nr:hypothetical protein [Stylosanthes scabra]
MEPSVGLIYEGYKEILFHHNITGGALILAHYEGNSHFRLKIVQCNEDDLFPLMVNNCTCYPQNLEVNQHNIRRMYLTSHPPYQLSQPILGIPVMTTADLSNVHRRVKLPIKFSTSNADGVYVVEKVVRHYHLEQFALNLPKELLRVAFFHKPKYITVIDGQSRLFNIRLRIKHKNRKTTVLGRVLRHLC